MKNPNFLIMLIILLPGFVGCRAAYDHPPIISTEEKTLTTEMLRPTLTPTIVPTRHTTLLPSATIEPVITPTPTVTVIPTQTLTPHPITIGKKELMAVVKVVEEFYADHGVYPNSIDDLIPQYIPQLPYTHDGHEIFYTRDDFAIFIVEYDPTEKNIVVT